MVRADLRLDLKMSLTPAAAGTLKFKVMLLNSFSIVAVDACRFLGWQMR